MEPETSSKKPLTPAGRKWIVLAAVAVALAAFCLWYTRPQSWAGVSGQRRLADPRAACQEIVWSASTPSFQNWELPERGAEEAGEAVLAAFQAGRYRASLGNLWAFRGGFDSDAQGMVRLVAAVGETELFSCWLTKREELFVYDGGRVLTYTADAGRYDAVASLVREYGVLLEEETG